MSDILNRGNPDFSKYDSMETEELEEILRLDSEAPEGTESDTEEILYIMGVLADRKKENNAGKTAQEAWESFKMNYLPQEEDVVHTQQTEPVKTGRSWMRRATAVAAVVALVVCVSATTNAFGWTDIWTTVAKWAKETFSFVSSGHEEITEPAPERPQQYTSLQQALSATGQKSDFVPTQIPEGYMLREIIIDETPIQNVYTGVYENGESNLVITVRSYLGTDLEMVEIDDGLLEIYERDGVKYHIFSNYEELRAMWAMNGYECYISGGLTVDEIKTMIDSIGKG